jgi:hypothetical protein
MVKNAINPNGLVLYRGPSDIDPLSEIVVVLTGLGGKSKNPKTGRMLQTWILATHTPPHELVKSGGDHVVCYDCSLRGGAGCYVRTHQAPLGVWRCWKRGGYVDYDSAVHDSKIAGSRIRWGSYGEPILIPLSLVAHLSGLASGTTGYTHQWRLRVAQAYSEYFMASVHNTSQGQRANELGWRYFRSAADGTPHKREIVCPASKEAGYRRTCATCNACHGAGSGHNVVIQLHGVMAKRASRAIGGAL